MKILFKFKCKHQVLRKLISTLFHLIAVDGKMSFQKGKAVL